MPAVENTSEYGYLDLLPLTEADKAQLRSLGAPSATALRAMISASPKAFHDLFGRARTLRLVKALEGLITDAERGFARSSVGMLPRTGALVDRGAPPIKPPPYDLKLRDKLFEELQALRHQQESTPSQDISRQITALEQRLNDMFGERPPSPSAR